MGIYLNPNNKDFWESVRSRIYVDKTGLISYTNECLHTEEKFICVSRPRRFGKSVALGMLAAYYSCGCDSKELFAKYRISTDAGFLEHLNKYQVILLNMQQFFSEAEEGRMIEYLERLVIRELREEYGGLVGEDNIKLSAALRNIYAKTDKSFIILIDE